MGNGIIQKQESHYSRNRMEDEIKLPPLPKGFKQAEETLPPLPEGFSIEGEVKKKIGVTTPTEPLDTAQGSGSAGPSTSNSPYTWEGFESIKVQPETKLPTAGTFATAKPEQANTGTAIPTKPTTAHKPEMKILEVDPSFSKNKPAEQTAKENPAFETITNAFVEMPDLFSDVGSAGTAGKDKRIEFYKMAYERSRGESKEFNVQEFEQLRDEAEKKWNNANELSEYSKLLAKEPDNPMYRYSVGFNQMELGKTQDAVNNFKAIIEQNPKFSPAYSALAYLHSDKGQNDVAVTFMDDAIENNPDDAALYSNRSILKQKDGDIKGAILDLDLAKGKTNNKSLQLEIEKQYRDIFHRLHANRDTKADRYISMIKGDYNPLDEEADKEFFKDRYNEHNTNITRLTKEMLEEQKNAGPDLEQKPLTVAEEMSGYVKGKGMREAMEAILFDPKQAGPPSFFF